MALQFMDLDFDVLGTIFDALEGPEQLPLTFVNRSLREHFRPCLAPECAVFSTSLFADIFAGRGWINLMEWNLTFATPMTVAWLKGSKSVAVRAALKGQLEALRWLDANDFAIEKSIISAAAENPHMDVIKWAVEEKDLEIPTNAASMAAYSGKVEAVKWLVDCGGPLATYSLNNAVLSKNLETIKYVFDTYGYPNGEEAMLVGRNACASGSIEIFDFIYDKGFDLVDERVFLEVCKSGKVPLMKHVFDLGFFDKDLSADALGYCAESGAIEAFDYVLSLGLPLTDKVTEAAARAPNPIPMIKHVVKCGAPIPKELMTMLLAPAGRFFHVSMEIRLITSDDMECISSLGCDINEAALTLAVERHQPQAAFWLLKKLGGNFSRQLFLTAAKCANWKAMDFGARFHGHIFDDEALRVAMESRSVNSLRWANLNRKFVSVTRASAALQAHFSKEVGGRRFGNVPVDCMTELCKLGAEFTEANFYQSLERPELELSNFIWNNGMKSKINVLDLLARVALDRDGHLSQHDENLLEWVHSHGWDDLIPENLISLDHRWYEELKEERDDEFDHEVNDYFYPTEEVPRRIIEDLNEIYEEVAQQRRAIPVRQRLDEIRNGRRGMPMRGRGFRGGGGRGRGGGGGAAAQPPPPRGRGRVRGARGRGNQPPPLNPGRGGGQ